MDMTMQTVACNICLREIPASEESSAEARDYIAYFFGLECYQSWRALQPDAERDDSAIAE